MKWINLIPLSSFQQPLPGGAANPLVFLLALLILLLAFGLAFLAWDKSTRTKNEQWIGLFFYHLPPSKVRLSMSHLVLCLVFQKWLLGIKRVHTHFRSVTCLLETGSKASCLVFCGLPPTESFPSAKDCLAGL